MISKDWKKKSAFSQGLENAPSSSLECPIEKLFRYRMTLAYDGAPYAGWQIQPDRPTIQGALEEALRRRCGYDIRVHGSGRTDTGVHAEAQVAHFDLQEQIVPSELQRSLNAMLDPAIRVKTLVRAASTFHARFSAVSKEYRYCIWNSAQLSPFLRHYRTWVREPLDFTAMRQAADLLIGKHDFSSFAADPGRVVDNPTRELYSLSLHQRGPEVRLVAQADGFLYRMVRSLAGFLLRVGHGAVKPEAVREILAARIRTAVVPTAPPEGLFLWSVRYRPWPMAHVPSPPSEPEL